MASLGSEWLIVDSKTNCAEMLRWIATTREAPHLESTFPFNENKNEANFSIGQRACITLHLPA